MAEQRTKFSGHKQALGALLEAYETAWREAGLHFSMSLSELLLLLHRLDQNSFDSGLYPLACFFNHACWPNCEGSASVIDSKDPLGDSIFEIRAIRDVSPGEHLCISYLADTMLCVKCHIVAICSYLNRGAVGCASLDGCSFGPGLAE